MSIRTLFHESFMVWAADRGIGRNPRDPQSEHLVFKDGGGAGRSWPYPKDASLIPPFVGALLTAVRTNDRYWVYPGRGVWTLGRDAEAWPQTRIWMSAVHAIGVPAGLRGAVCFNSTDWNALHAMLFLQITLGPSVHIDTIVIPEPAHTILHFDRRKVVSAAVRDEARLEAFVKAMQGAGFPLPAEPHDETRKSVAWMESKGAGSARGA